MTTPFLLVVATLIAAILALRFAFPNRFVRLGIRIVRRLCGFRTRSLDVDGTAWPYLVAGPESAPVLMLLHGFGGDKDNWPLYARHLRRACRIVIPDLPGFGDNVRNPAADYRIAAQVPRLHEFINAMGIDRLHLGGNSMGGALALKYTLTYPARVLTLALLNNAGIDGGRKSDIEIAADRGESPLTVSSLDEFDELMALITYRPIPLPRVVKRVIGEEAIRRQQFLHRIFVSLLEEFRQQPFNDQLSALATPTLVIWGQYDRLIDVSCAHVMAAKIPDCTCVIFADTGHVPMLERPDEAAARHLGFLDAYVRQTLSTGAAAA